MAMAQHRLQRAQEARAALTEGAKIAKAQMGKRENGQPFQDDWPGWIIVRALLREARALIEQPPAVPGTEQPKLYRGTQP